MVENIRKFETLFVLDNGLFESFYCVHQASVKKNFANKTNKNDGNGGCHGK